MPSRPCLEDALGVLRAELDVERSPVAELTTQDAWLAYLRFGRQHFHTAPTPDYDGLLCQYGTYAFTGTPMFALALTRQFVVVDADGDHDHYLQVHCELRYEPDPVLEALGNFDSWFFHNAGADLGPWAEAMGGHLVPLLGRIPTEVELYEEQV